MNPIITEQLKSLYRGLKEGIILPGVGNRTPLLKKTWETLEEEYLCKAFKFYPVDFQQERVTGSDFKFRNFIWEPVLRMG